MDTHAHAYERTSTSRCTRKHTHTWPQADARTQGFLASHIVWKQRNVSDSLLFAFAHEQYSATTIKTAGRVQPEKHRSALPKVGRMQAEKHRLELAKAHIQASGAQAHWSGAIFRSYALNAGSRYVHKVSKM